MPTVTLFRGFNSPDHERTNLLSSLYLWLSAGVYLGDWRFDLISKRYDSTLDCLTALGDILQGYDTSMTSMFTVR